MTVMDREWTDKRMDDFATGVDRRFDQVDRQFDQVDRRFDQVDRRLDRLETKLDRLTFTAWGAVAAAAVVKLLFG